MELIAHESPPRNTARPLLDEPEINQLQSLKIEPESAQQIKDCQVLLDIELSPVAIKRDDSFGMNNDNLLIHSNTVKEIYVVDTE